MRWSGYRGSNGTPRPFVAIIAAVAAVVTLATGVVLAPAASGIPPGDATAHLQAELDQLAPGQTLVLEPGTYQHSDILTIRVPGVQIDGNGATLVATNDARSGLQIWADGVSIRNMNLAAPLAGQRYYGTDQHKLLVRADGVTLSNVTITGSAAAGVYIAGASNFRLDQVTVRDTRADGIAMSAGSSAGQVNNALTERTGDDGISVVSYTDRYRGYRGPPCRDIVIDSPVVNGTTQARGLIVSGGENIVFRNINVSNTSSAGVLITSQADPIFTSPVNGVEISGGSITNANTAPRVMKGAIAVYSGYLPIAGVRISDLTIADTPATAERNITVEAVGGGDVSDVSIHDIRLTRTDLPAIYSNVPADRIQASGFMRDDAPIDTP